MHNASARVRIINNFAQDVDIMVNHIYSTSPAEVGHWSDLPAGTTSSAANDLTVTYNTGGTAWGLDHWLVTVTEKSGQQWISQSGTVTLHNGDRNSVITVAVSPANARVTASTNSGTLSWASHP